MLRRFLDKFKKPQPQFDLMSAIQLSSGSFRLHRVETETEPLRRHERSRRLAFTLDAIFLYKFFINFRYTLGHFGRVAIDHDVAFYAKVN
jgi:hypothetical protein